MVMRFWSRWAFGCLLLAGAMVLRADAAKPVLEQTAKDGQPAVTFCDKTVVVGSGKNVSLVEDPLDGRTAVRLAAGGRAVFSLGEGGPANTVITACVLVNNRFERRDLWQRLGTSCNFVPYANPGTWPTLTFVGKEK